MAKKPKPAAKSADKSKAFTAYMGGKGKKGGKMTAKGKC